MSLLHSEAVHSRCIETHRLGSLVLLRCRNVWCPSVRRPWEWLVGGVQSERIIKHDGLCLGVVLHWARLSTPEVVGLRLHRSSHWAHVTKLLHVRRQLQHGKLHRSLLSGGRSIRVRNVLLRSHEPPGCYRRRSAEGDTLNRLRLLDGSASGWRRSLHLAGIALREGHVLW
jgi:hypothetical protein